jgi:Bacterial DNA topoisomerase IB, N-terminal domain
VGPGTPIPNMGVSQPILEISPPPVHTEMNTSTSSAETLPLDPVDAAAAARLRCVNDTGPGIQRIRAGRSFRYYRNDGASVTDPLTLQRIRGLAIPPAWRDVWICPTSAGHIQAVGHPLIAPSSSDGTVIPSYSGSRCQTRRVSKIFGPGNRVDPATRRGGRGLRDSPSATSM